MALDAGSEDNIPALREEVYACHEKIQPRSGEHGLIRRKEPQNLSGKNYKQYKI